MDRWRCATLDTQMQTFCVCVALLSDIGTVGHIYSLHFVVVAVDNTKQKIKTHSNTLQLTFYLFFVFFVVVVVAVAVFVICWGSYDIASVWWQMPHFHIHIHICESENAQSIDASRYAIDVCVVRCECIWSIWMEYVLIYGLLCVISFAFVESPQYC